MAKKKKDDPEVISSERSDLVDSLADNLNSQFKDLRVAYVLNKDTDAPADISDWVSTGNDILDVAISNKPHGGLPFGRIVEISGQNSSGKSLLCAHIAAETQKMGGVVIYYDTESAMSKKFAEAIGIDLSKMVYAQIETLEDIFQSMETLIEKIRKNDTGIPVTFVVDSIMGATTKIEMEADYDKDGWATSKAIILSKAMRKITNLIARKKILLVLSNQLRTKLGVTWGDQFTTSGGSAIGFHSSVRLRMKSVGQIKVKINSIEQVVGTKIAVQVIKNRVGPPFRSATFNVYFESGIDNIDSWLTVMTDHKLVSQGGAWYSYSHPITGEEIKFQSKTFDEKILSNPELKEVVYNQICDCLIMKYKTENVNAEDLIMTSEVIQED